jgi:hypothetical protein
MSAWMRQAPARLYNAVLNTATHRIAHSIVIATLPQRTQPRHIHYMVSSQRSKCSIAGTPFKHSLYGGGGERIQSGLVCCSAGVCSCCVMSIVVSRRIGPLNQPGSLSFSLPIQLAQRLETRGERAAPRAFGPHPPLAAPDSEAGLAPG